MIASNGAMNIFAATSLQQQQQQHQGSMMSSVPDMTANPMDISRLSHTAIAQWLQQQQLQQQQQQQLVHDPSVQMAEANNFAMVLNPNKTGWT